VGTWIEIGNTWKECLANGVVPFVGTWIEIVLSLEKLSAADASFPSWERGLKLFCPWKSFQLPMRRSLRGNVD